MDKRMKAQLTIGAKAMTCWIRKLAKGLVHHSDRGSQHACHEYLNFLDTYGMIPSMSRNGDCWNNSPTEHFFRSLKSERLSDYVLPTRKTAKKQVIDYIGYYNGICFHSTLRY